MTDWIEVAAGNCQAEYPLHSGLVHAWRNNLIVLSEQNLIDISMTPNDSNEQWSQAISTSDEWLIDLAHFPVPLRRKPGELAYRDIKVSFDARLAGNIETYITVLLRSVRHRHETETVSGNPGDQGATGSITIAGAGASSWAEQTTTITPTVSGQMPGPEAYPADTMGSRLPFIPVVYCSLIASAASATTLYLRSLRVQEVA